MMRRGGVNLRKKGIVVGVKCNVGVLGLLRSRLEDSGDGWTLYLGS